MPRLVRCVSFSEAPELSVWDWGCSREQGEAEGAAAVPGFAFSVIIAPPPPFSQQGRCHRHLSGGLCASRRSPESVQESEIQSGETSLAVGCSEGQRRGVSELNRSCFWKRRLGTGFGLVLCGLGKGNIFYRKYLSSWHVSCFLTVTILLFWLRMCMGRFSNLWDSQRRF